MKILLVAATDLELEGIFSHPKWGNVLAKHEITAISTGIGMVNTAYQLGKYLAHHRPEWAVHFGIAGTLDKNLALGAVVEIIEDTFADLGAEDHDDFLDLEKMGFPSLKNPLHYNTYANPLLSPLPYPKVTGITVNTVTGSEETTQKLTLRWKKQVETMESAAFFQVMTAENIGFTSLRGISNRVEGRNRASWQIKEAIQAVQEAVIDLLS